MSTDVQGTVDPRFEPVREAFAANLADGLDQGAAFAVVADGRLVVDLWGGYADAAGKRPWARDTLVNVWSTTKGVVALAIAMLVDRGLLDYEAPVSRTWPEFAANGKEHIRLGYLMSHRAGLPGCERPMTLDDLFAWRPYVDCLVHMAPLLPPGKGCAYHAVSFGHLAGEVLRRADGRSVGAFVAEEIAGPLDSEIFIGLPEAEDARVAEIITGPGADDPLIQAEARPLSRICFLNPRVDPLEANHRAWRAAEVPSGNAQADALGLARVYGALARGGRYNGARLLAPETLAAAVEERFRGPEAAFEWPVAFAAGFMLNEESELGPGGPRVFGHNGWGGSYAFADPEAGLGVAYVMNRMLGFGDDPDPRQTRLLDALYGAL